MEHHFPCHVLAHHDGRYQTTVSHGITPNETKALEQFLFGQTNNAEYLESLQSQPGIIWRRVGNRFALTRVRKGDTDPDGRSTLIFETLLDTGTHSLLVQRACETVLANWTFSKAGALVRYPSERPQLDLHPENLSEILLAVRNDKRVVRQAAMFSLRDVGKIIASCADDTSFSICFKSLNRQCPFRINLSSLKVSEKELSLPPSGRAGQQRLAPPTRGDLAVPRTNASDRTNMPVVMLIILVLFIQIVILWRTPNVSNSLQPSDAMQDHILTRIEEAKKEVLKNEQINNKLLATIERMVQDQLGHIRKLETRFEESTNQARSQQAEMQNIVKDIRLALARTKEEQAKLDKDLSELLKTVKASKNSSTKLTEKLKLVESTLKTFHDESSKSNKKILGLLSYDDDEDDSSEGNNK